MRDNKRISLIIPCYNEEKTIGGVLKQVPDFIDEIVVVDNNSTDKTVLIARNYDKVVLVKEKKQGYGVAIKKGIKTSTGDISAIIDGDGQHFFKDVEKLIKILIQEKIDFIWGARPFQKKKMPLSRIFGNKLQTFIVNLLFGINLKDSQSGMMIFRKKELLKKIPLEKLDDGMAFSEEIKIRALFKGFLWREIGIDIRPRKGPSRLRPLPDGIKNLRLLLRLFYELKVKGRKKTA